MILDYVSFDLVSIVAAAGLEAGCETELCSAAMLTPGGCVDSFGAKCNITHFSHLIS